MVIDEELYPIMAHDGALTIAFIIGPIVLLVISLVLTLLIVNAMAKRRALQSPPIGYSEGMVLDRKTNKLKGTKTAVHFDPVSGKRFFGKTVYE